MRKSILSAGNRQLGRALESENTAKPQKQGTMTEADNVPADVCTGPDRGGPAQSITRRNAGQTVIGKRHLAATNHEIRRIAFCPDKGYSFYGLEGNDGN